MARIYCEDDMRNFPDFDFSMAAIMFPAGGWLGQATPDAPVRQLSRHVTGQFREASYNWHPV